MANSTQTNLPAGFVPDSQGSGMPAGFVPDQQPTPIQDTSSLSAPPTAWQRIKSAISQGGAVGAGQELGRMVAEPLEQSQIPLPGVGKTLGQGVQDLQKLINIGGTEASMLAGPGIGEAGIAKIPSTARAARNIEAVESAIGTHPINIDKGAGDAAMRAWEISRRGGGTVKAIEDFVRRIVTDPDPMTFGEARDFYKNLKPSIMERLTNKGPLKAAVAEFKTQLGNALSETAANADRLQQYQQGLKEYHQAAQLKGAVAAGGALALKNLLPYSAYVKYLLSGGK